VDDCTGADALVSRRRDSTPWPGWPACRLILARFVPENCSSHHRPVTMDTTIASAWRTSNCAVVRRRSFRDMRTHRHRCIAVADTFEALKQLARSTESGRKLSASGLCRQDHHERDPAALLGAKLRVLKSEGTLTTSTAAADAFSPEETHQAAVLEMECRAAANSRGWRRLPAGRWSCDACSPAHWNFFRRWMRSRLRNAS